MILLEKLLAGLDVRVVGFALCQIAKGCAAHLGTLPAPSFHYCLDGTGAMRVGRGPETPIGRHSVAVVPASCPVVIAEGACCGPISAMPVCSPVTTAVGEPPDPPDPDGVTIVCGELIAIYRGAQGLFDHLVEPLVDHLADDEAIARPLTMLLDELARPGPGTGALVDALMHQCLVLLLRRHCESGECRLPWLSALEDLRLGRALGAMLERPDRGFSLEELATIAGMSRSAFAAGFSAAFERPPMDFLKELRLRRGAELLRASDLPVKTIARRVGYDSRSYFSRAFKARYGIDPAGYRTSAAAGSGSRAAARPS